MDATSKKNARSAADLARKIRIEWAIRQYRKGFMDMQEAALAARIPVTTFAAAVELGVPRFVPASGAASAWAS